MWGERFVIEVDPSRYSFASELLCSKTTKLRLLVCDFSPLEPGDWGRRGENDLKVYEFGISLAVRWLRFHVPVQGLLV